ncbi:hypothetical protein ESV85_05920 [Algoriphagus aquimarinus]|uniref:Cytochrome c domain-containing protein n=1 Tax=Algoriphagus aquimarinus TaxID=237018 RepID=A0A5C7B126_9BACT|nr:hypothetical protein ESV85_05920 [Algoriphagus aquimarinus]
MKKLIWVSLFILIIVLVGIQFIPTNHNPNIPAGPDDFLVTNSSPVHIGKMLKTSCYNCHSDQVNYPWYSNFQPAGWLLDKHIKEGISELNFSEFGRLSGRMKKMKLESMIKQIEQEKMPISSYTLVHREAILSDAERKELTTYLKTLH